MCVYPLGPMVIQDGKPKGIVSAGGKCNAFRLIERSSEDSAMYQSWASHHLSA